MPVLSRAFPAAAVAAALLLVLVLVPASPRVQAAAPTLPSDRLHFGLSNFDAGWMNASGVPWKYRYQYLAGGVYSSWTAWNSPPGQFATNYLSATPSGTIPAFTYYMLLQSHRASDEATDDYDNVNSASLMSLYYGDFRLLMQKVGGYGQPAVVHVEPDFWGYMQQRSGNTSPAGVSASVASSGFADVQGYPNTVAGFGQALLHLRDLYAPNAVMAIHASLWSSLIDVGSTTDPTVNVRTEADKTAAFLNASGAWDTVFNDVDDHDAGWWEAQGANNQWSTHWWDPTNQALPNFTRYLSWVDELHARTARPQVVWQVPVGNQYFLTENNTCGHYQDNVAQYFLGHPADLFAAGLVAVLFGAGNGCQTTNEDGQGDGVTNNGGLPTTDAAGWCSACNSHASTYPDDDGGFLRIFVGRYYTALPGRPAGVSACAGDGYAVVSWQAPAGGGPVASYSVAANPAVATVTTPGAKTWAAIGGLTDGTAYSFSVTAGNSNGSGPASASSGQVIPRSLSPPWPGTYHPLPPARLLDTRTGFGGLARLGGGQAAELDVLGRGDIPGSGVAGLLLNVTVTGTGAPGYLAVYPGGGCRGMASNLNFVGGQTVANLVAANLGGNGRVAFYNGSPGGSDLVVDVEGWVSTSAATSGPAGRFRPLDPVRLLDTRSSVQVGGGQTITLAVAGRAGVPTGAGAAALNLTVTGTGAAGYLTAYPAGQTAPLASNLNFVTAQTVANRTVAVLGSNGQVSFYNGSPAPLDLVVDLNGWYSGAASTATTGGTFSGEQPVRLLDTRDGTGGIAAPVTGGGVLTLPIAGGVGVPASGVSAVVLNVTAVNTTSPGYLTVFGGSRPLASDLNFVAGGTVPNLVVVKLGSDGAVRLYNGSPGSLDLLADLVGWYAT